MMTRAKSIACTALILRHYCLERLHSDSPAGKTYSVQVGICSVSMPVIGFWHVVIDDDVDPLYINPTSHKIRCNKNALLAFFELLVDR